MYRIDRNHSPEELHRGAIARIQPYLNGAITLHHQRDHVKICGQVASYYQKQIAQEALLKMSTGYQVHNELEVQTA